MDRRPSENNQPLQMQFVAAANGPNMPAAVQLRTHEQPPHPGLRESLYSALNEIKSLKDQNKSLMTENSELKKELTDKDKALERAKAGARVLGYASKEWRTRCEVIEKGLTANTFQLQELNTELQKQEQVSTNRQVEVSRLQEELREKTFLLNMEIQKHQATTKAHVETQQQLSRKETQLNRIEGQWESRCDALEESHVSNSTQLQELNIKLQEQEQVLTSRQVEVSRLQEELQEKTGLLDWEIRKRQARSKAHVETLYQLSLKETELSRIEGQWKSRCDALEENHVSSSTQLQELNIKLQEQEQVLTSRQVEVSRLKEKLTHNKHILLKAVLKRRFNTNDHEDTQDQSAQTEQELKRSWCDALEENHVSSSTQLQELNIKLQEQEQVLTSMQVEVSRLQEELQEKNRLLDWEIRKRQARSKAHVETLYQLSRKETELSRIEGQWKSRCDALEENHVSSSTQLQELNIKLQEQEQVLTSRQVEVSCLQEELQEKNRLLDWEIRKRQARSKAHVETLYQLSLKETELSRIEGQWKSRCDALEENHVSSSTQLQELNIKLQEQEQVLTSRQVEVSRLKEKLTHNEHILMKAVLKRRFNTNDHVDTQDQSAQTEQELKRSWCDALEENHVSSSTQLQELNIKLQEQEQVLTSRQVEVSRLQEELQEKNRLLNWEIRKRQARSKAHVETLHQLSLKETELSRIEGQWKSRCDALEENHVSSSTQLQQLNIKLQEQEQVLTSRQVEVSRLQEELQEKTGLLDREIQKRQARSKAHVETLYQLSLKDPELMVLFQSSKPCLQLHPAAGAQHQTAMLPHSSMLTHSRRSL